MFEEFENIEIRIDESEEDYVDFIASVDGKEIGRLVVEKRFSDDEEYFGEEIFQLKSFKQIFTEDLLVDVQYLKVEDSFRSKGVAAMLVKKAIEHMRTKGFKCFFLNASPMGTEINLDRLVDFYKKFGFKELLRQGRNVIMGLKLKQ